MNRKIIKPTPFGSVGLIWTAADGNPKIVRVLLPRPGFSAEAQVSALFPASRSATCAAIEATAAAIQGFLEGERIEFALELADLTLCSEFQRLVLGAEHGIPRGRISTYRLIAAHLGKRNGARAVGNALATNPFPLIVPCHRAVRSDRLLGGYQGGPEMKRALLEQEGIPFDRTGRVACAQFHYGGETSPETIRETGRRGRRAPYPGPADELCGASTPSLLA